MSTAVRADDFIASIGVDQHLNWDGTVYANAPLELQELQYLGITAVRDAPPAPWNLSQYVSLANAGIKFDFVTGAVSGDITSSLPTELSWIDGLAKAVPGSVAFVEAPNELNGQIVTYNGASSADPSVGAAIERFDYTGLHNDALLMSQGVKLINVSLTNGIGGWENYLAGLGNLSTTVDYANWHVYFNGGAQPAANVASMRLNALQPAPGRPVVFTEAGYFTAFQDGSGWGGVSEAVQAKNTLNLLADAYKAGVARTYLYELMEGAANPPTTDIENTFGLFHSGGAAKPVATAIHNLTAILADPATNGTTFTTGSLAYSISGLPSTGNSLLLEKASGTFDLMVWNEAPDWNPSTRSAITVAPLNSVVSLGAVYGTVKVFDPLQGTAAIQTLTNVNSVTLGLTDHPLVVEVSGAGVAPPPADPPPVVTPLGASPNGTTITSPAGAPIIDGAGNSWTLVQSADRGVQIAINGVVDAPTAFVVKLETLNAAMVQENSAGNWYSETQPNDSWVRLSGDPNPVVAPPPTPPPPPVTTHQLVLVLAEDRYKGDAKFIAKVDGAQVGSGTVTALEKLGATQNFTFTGQWAAGKHDIEVDFINDRWNGTPSTDRNLYVDGVKYDGASYLDHHVALLSNGAVHFTVGT